MPDSASTTELDRERQDLLKADKDIREGIQRVDHQQDIIGRLAEHGHDIGQALVLLENLQDMLEAWRRHRELIIQRIVILENAH